MDLTHFGAGLGLHAPQAAGAVDVAAVGDEQNFLAVARPDRADLVVIGGVVVARQLGFVLGRELLHVAECAAGKICGENVEVAVE